MVQVPVSGAVLISQSEYQNLTAYAGPQDPVAAQAIAMTCAGTVVACFLLSLGVGTVVRMVRDA